MNLAHRVVLNVSGNRIPGGALGVAGGGGGPHRADGGGGGVLATGRGGPRTRIARCWSPRREVMVAIPTGTAISNATRTPN